MEVAMMTIRAALALLDRAPADEQLEVVASILAMASQAILLIAEGGAVDQPAAWTAADELVYAGQQLSEAGAAGQGDTVSGAEWSQEPALMIDLLSAAARALDRATRTATAPEKILLLARASDHVSAAHYALGNA